MKNINFIIANFSLLFLSPVNILGQNNIDNFINRISNDQLRFKAVKVGITRILDSSKIELPKNLVFITSINVDSLLTKVGKKEMISTLIPLLQDPNKDWYANVLLYQITERDASQFIVFEEKDAWIKWHRERDIEYWNNYSPVK